MAEQEPDCKDGGTGALLQGERNSNLIVGRARVATDRPDTSVVITAALLHDRTTARPHDRKSARLHDCMTARPHDFTADDFLYDPT